MVYIVWKTLELIWITFVGNYALRICDFGGQWSVTLKNRGGQSKETEGRTGPKNKGGSLAVGTYLLRRITIMIKNDFVTFIESYFLRVNFK